MADGKVVISTGLDNSGFEKDAQKAGTSLRSQAANLSASWICFILRPLCGILPHLDHLKSRTLKSKGN